MLREPWRVCREARVADWAARRAVRKVWARGGRGGGGGGGGGEEGVVGGEGAFMTVDQMTIQCWWYDVDGVVGEVMRLARLERR